MRIDFGCLRRVVAPATIVGLGLALLAPCGSALAQEDIYKGKTIRLIVGSEAGGGYDAYGRLLAAHMVKYIPAHPVIIVQNMPGAGALVLANHMANVLANDITVIGGVNPLVAIHPLYTPDMAKYDARKLAWIGSMQADTFVAIARKESAVQKFADIFEKEFVVGGSGGASTEYPPIVNAALGTKFKLVLGYKGTAQSMLAVERGEVDGLGAQTLASLKAQSSRQLADKTIRILVQYTPKRNPEIPDIPTVYEFAKTDAEHQFLTAVFAYQGVGRAFIMPPGMPDNVVAIMRKAFDDTMKDKTFLDEAEKRKIDLEPQSGAPIQKLVDEVAATPPEIIARINKIKSEQK